MKFRRTKKIHFVGVGGSGMSGIAEILLSMGYSVTGSDLSESETVARLRKAGAKVLIGHDEKNVGDAEVVVISSAVRDSNPEVVEAKSRQIPVIPRAEMLAELMRMKHAVAVGGSHGKTTVTSMTSVVMTKGGFEPTIIIGGRLDRLGSGAQLGKGEYLVAEADESDGSFLNLYSTIAVVTNIDSEHLDYYGSFDAVKKAFIRFVNKVPFYGASILCIDDPAVQEIVPDIKKRFLTYGVTSTADVVAHDITFDKFESSFSVKVFGREVGRMTIGMPGIHSVYNALAALAVGVELEMRIEDAMSALTGFAGIDRRLQKKGEADGVMVLDDYGHHPNEIKATLRGIKEGFPDRRLTVIFQPHRYSRTRDQMDEFHKAFYDADELIITPIYAASEDPIEGVTAEAIAIGASAHRKGEARFVDSLDEAVKLLAEEAKTGDIVLTLGAGDITKVGSLLLDVLSQRSEG